MQIKDAQSYRDAVREKICTFCVERDVHGDCTRPAGDPCVLETHVEFVVDTILSVGGSARIEDYLEAMRKRLCPLCHQDGEGFCELRTNTACALDSYVLRIVEVIEEVVPELGPAAAREAETKPLPEA